MAVTPVILAAVLTAAPRFAKELLLASTSGMWQSGHVAATMSRSSEISCAQPPLVLGYDLPPRWSIFWKQPLAVVHAGSPLGSAVGRQVRLGGRVVVRVDDGDGAAT